MTRGAELMRCASLCLAFATLSPVGAQEAASKPEHLSPYGLAKPVLIVAADMPKRFDNKDKIAVLDARSDAPPDGFEFLKKIDDAPASGKIGIYVPPEAIFRIKGRTMSNVGSGAVTIRLAQSMTLAPRSIKLEGRQSADYNELRRCAAHRAGANQYPPKELAAPFVARGTLVSIGGG